MAAAKKEHDKTKRNGYNSYTEAQNPQDPDRLRFLEVLSECNGLISFACEKFGISRQTYYRWVEEDWFKQAVEEINTNVVTEKVESKMFEKINGVLVQKIIAGIPIVYDVPPSDRMIEFFLKSRAGKKGYGDKTDITSGGEKISAPIIINLTDKDDESDPM
jgi:hypothetical protein